MHTKGDTSQKETETKAGRASDRGKKESRKRWEPFISAERASGGFSLEQSFNVTLNLMDFKKCATSAECGMRGAWTCWEYCRGTFEHSTKAKTFNKYSPGLVNCRLTAGVGPRPLFDPGHQHPSPFLARDRDQDVVPGFNTRGRTATGKGHAPLPWASLQPRRRAVAPREQQHLTRTLFFNELY